MERDTLDHQLFSWEGVDLMDTADLQFYDVELKVPVGEYPAGTKFKAAFMLVSASMLILMDDKEEQHAYELKASVGEKIDLDTLKCDEGCGCGHEH